MTGPEPPPPAVPGRPLWEPGLTPPVDGADLPVSQAAGPDLFRPASEILTIIEEALTQPDIVPPPVTLDVALATNPDHAWPCMDWCCTRGCPGPGNSLCRTAMSGECDGRCTCGEQHARDVVRQLQDAVRYAQTPQSFPTGLLGTGMTLTMLTGGVIARGPEPCTRPWWLPAALHFHACPGGAQ